MQTAAIIGAQWGDEGKGKITDWLGQHADYVVRYQGGNNAGHTIIVDDVKTVLHLIPSGILHSNCISLIAHGVVFDPQAFLVELDEVQKTVAVNPESLRISQYCSVITSYHRLLDSAREGKSSTKIGTTGKGIGPAYEDKVARKGIKLVDLLDKEKLLDRLKVCFDEKLFLFKEFYKLPVPTLEEEAEELYQMGQKIKPYLDDTFQIIEKALNNNKKILFEGAQGILLDVDYGSYPFVTSSSTAAGGIFTGAGLSKGKVDEIIGIVKAYTTRVGEGPFPTEQLNGIGETIQQKGHEFGATTGRKRRCGWLDLPLLRYAIKSSAITSLALTKVDILSDLEELKVCYAYEYQGKEITTAFPGIDLYQVKPLYKSFQPFSDSFKDHQYSAELKLYLDYIEEKTQTPVGIVAYGPERKQIHFKKDYFQ